MFKAKTITIDAASFAAYSRTAVAPVAVFQREGNTIESYLQEFGHCAEKVIQPSGRHWHVLNLSGAQSK